MSHEIGSTSKKRWWACGLRVGRESCHIHLGHTCSIHLDHLVLIFWLGSWFWDVLGVWNKVPQCGRVWHVWHICFPRSLSRLSPDFSTDEYRAWCIENRESQTVPTIRSLWYPYVYILPSNDWDRDPVGSYGDVNTSLEQIQPPGLWLAIRKKILARVHPTAVRKTRPTRLTLLALLAHFSGEHAGTCKNGSDTRFLNPIWDVMQWCIGLGGSY